MKDEEYWHRWWHATWVLWTVLIVLLVSLVFTKMDYTFLGSAMRAACAAVILLRTIKREREKRKHCVKMKSPK